MLPLSESSNTPIRVSYSELEFRRMRDSDVPSIMEIESVSFGRHHWSPDSFHNEMNNQIGRYYVLLHHQGNDEPRLIGYCGFWMVIDEAHITTVAVRPEYRGNSLGELLLVRMTERCLGSSIHWMTLEVRVGNYTAQNLYYKYGYQSMGIRKKYYQDNLEDALIMTTPNISGEDYRNLYRGLKNDLSNKMGGFPKGFEDS
jgi:[ribosomal protein S18]-alanine N-acetyltransferase